MFNQRILYQLAGGLVFLLTLCSPIWSEQQANLGQAILQKVFNTYRELNTYQDETILIINITAQGIEQKMENKYRLSLERPNKLAFILKSGMMGMTLVSDGKKTWTYMPMLKKYMVEEAPESLQKLLEGSLLEIDMQGTTGITIFSLFGDAPYKTLMEKVKSIEFIGDETIAGTETHHLLLHQEQMDVELWIDAQTYFLRKVSVDMSKITGKQKPLTPGLGEMKMTFEEIHDKIRIGEAIPADVFIFSPPEGTEETNNLFADLRGDRESSSLVGEQAQDFTLELLKEGISINLNDYKGKVIMLDFWSTWCEPCLQKLPILQKIYDEYKKKEFIFIAINSRENKKTVQEFIEKEGYTFPVALDIEGKAGELYEVKVYPTLVIIDKTGKIQVVHTGFSPGFHSQLKQELEQIFAGKDLAQEPAKPYKKITSTSDANDQIGRDYREALLKFHRRHLGETYEKLGLKNPDWDEAVLQFLERYALFSAYIPHAPAAYELREEAENLLKNGCQDPLIQYCYGVLLLNDPQDLVKAEPILLGSLEAFQKANYSKYRLAAAALRLAQSYQDRHKNMEYNIWATKGIKFLLESISDGSFKEEKKQRILAEIIIGYVHGPLKSKNQEFYDSFKKVPGIDPWLVYVIGGECEIRQAWLKRGGNWASQVTEEGWQGFRDHLGKARQLLIKAWEMHPEYPEAATSMIVVSMGQSERDEFRLWFDRAISAQFDYQPAYNNLLWALQPRWGGSHRAMYEFGLECLATKRFDTQVPWNFFKVVRDIGSEKDNWQDAFRKPDVFKNLSDLYEGYIAEPSAKAEITRYKSYYVITAWCNGKYEKAHTLLKELGNEIHMDSLRDFYYIQPEKIIGEIYASIGTHAEKTRKVEQYLQKGKRTEAIALLKELLEDKELDSKADFSLRDRLNVLQWEEKLTSGKWVDILPEKGFAGWQIKDGDWTIGEDGTVLVLSLGRGFYLQSKLDLKGSYEVRGTVQFISDAEGTNHAGLLLGCSYVTNKWRWQVMFSLFKNPNMVLLQSSGVQIPKYDVSIGNTNTFLIQVWNKHITVYINDKPVVINQDIGQSGRSAADGKIGLGAWKPHNYKVGFRELQVRRLQTKPPGFDNGIIR